MAVRATAAAWSHASARAHAWRGLAVYGADGTTARVPDSAENRAHFGGQDTRWDSTSGYPLVRLVTLMALRLHILAGARFGAYALSEGALADELWPLLPYHSLAIVDRGLFSARILVGIERGGIQRHWLTRAKSTLASTRIERFAAGDELIELNVSKEARQKDPSMPATWRMRAIRYQRRGFPPQVLLTSLLDPKRYPAAEIVALYHERWEIELGYNEVNRVMLAREESTRSKSPGASRRSSGASGSPTILSATRPNASPPRQGTLCSHQLRRHDELHRVGAADLGHRQRRPVGRAADQAARGPDSLRSPRASST